MIFSSFQTFSISTNCQPKEVYLKVFGDAQDYSRLQNPIAIAKQIRGRWRYNNIIIDWKYKEGNLTQFLEQFLK
jgi:hypothetical protein